MEGDHSEAKGKLGAISQHQIVLHGLQGQHNSMAHLGGALSFFGWTSSQGWML
jgi:hypothetical protein